MHQSDIHPVFVRIGTTIVVPAKAGMTAGMSTTWPRACLVMKHVHNTGRYNARSIAALKTTT
jgi:hypothetical protein